MWHALNLNFKPIYMKKLYSLILLSSLLFVVETSNATTWNITNSGFTFSPAAITINLGDTVMFNIQTSHNVVEVTMSTWNANGNTSNGGFQLPFGGGMFVPTVAKTYYYVCQPHAGNGMKGQIVVNNSTGIPTPDEFDYVLNFMPNPTSKNTRIHTGYPDGISNTISVFDITGKLIFSQKDILNNHLLDVSLFRNGIYFVEFKSENYLRTKKLVVSRN